jgi:hypothetical protein
MKKNILAFSALAMLTFIAVSCGKTNTVGAPATEVNHLSADTINSEITNFEGTYDLIRMRTEDCGASIRLVRECSGLRLLSNNMGPEEFCNINKGESRSTRENSSTINTTLIGNVLKSVVTLNDGTRTNNRVQFTNTLTLGSNGSLEKISNLKSRSSVCLYQKR